MQRWLGGIGSVSMCAEQGEGNHAARDENRTRQEARRARVNVRYAGGCQVDETENHAQCSSGDTKRAKSNAEPLEGRESRFLLSCFHDEWMCRGLMDSSGH